MKKAGWISASNKKSKRLFPKKMASDFVNTSRIDHNIASAYNQQRSKATQGPREDSEHKLDNNFLTEIPLTRSLSTYDPKAREWVRSERGKVVDRQRELVSFENKGLLELYRVWQGGKYQGVSKFNILMLEKRDRYRLYMFFSGNDWLIVQEVNNKRWISHVYVGRAAAEQARQLGFINWNIIEHITEE